MSLQIQTRRTNNLHPKPIILEVRGAESTLHCNSPQNLSIRIPKFSVIFIKTWFSLTYGSPISRQQETKLNKNPFEQNIWFPFGLDGCCVFFSSKDVSIFESTSAISNNFFLNRNCEKIAYVSRNLHKKEKNSANQCAQSFAENNLCFNKIWIKLKKLHTNNAKLTT